MILLTDEGNGEIAKQWLKAYGAGKPLSFHDWDNMRNKAQLKRIAEWGNEECREHKYYPQLPYWPRRRCNECWQALLEETR